LGSLFLRNFKNQLFESKPIDTKRGPLEIKAIEFYSSPLIKLSAK